MTLLHPRFVLSAAVAAGLFAAAAGSAGTLTSASWLQTSQGFPMSRTNGQLGASGSSTGTSISANLSYPQTTIKFFLPKTPNGTIDVAVTITQGGTQALTATAGMASANTGVMGTVLIMTAQHSAMGVDQSMYAIGGNTIVAIPVSIGKSGQVTGDFLVLGITHTITVDFYGWTPGTIQVTGLSSAYAPDPTPTATEMGSLALTPGGGGTVTLVSAALVKIDGAFAQQRTVSFTKLTLLFVPEPGTLLLLGAAALALGWSARRA